MSMPWVFCYYLVAIKIKKNAYKRSGALCKDPEVITGTTSYAVESNVYAVGILLLSSCYQNQEKCLQAMFCVETAIPSQRPSMGEEPNLMTCRRHQINYFIVKRGFLSTLNLS